MDEQVVGKENDPCGGAGGVATATAEGEIAASCEQPKPDAAVPLLSLTDGTGPPGALEQLGVMQDEAYALEKEIDDAEKKMKEYESSTRYVEAERERKNLEQLKIRRKMLAQRHVESYQRVDAEQLKSFAREKQQAFDERWEQAFVAHNQKTRKLYNTLKERHNVELVRLKAELEKKENGRHPKSSTGLLELRTKQRALARCQRYVEAETIRKTADIREMKELKEHVCESQRQNQVQVDMLLNQHRVEMDALRQKTKLERKVMMEDRNKEQEQLDNRLRNSASEMNRMHTKQSLVAEGKLFDTGFYTQRGAARSSIPLVSGHLSTSTSTRTSIGNTNASGSGGASGSQPPARIAPADQVSARKPLPAILSAEQLKQLPQDLEASNPLGSKAKQNKSPAHHAASRCHAQNNPKKGAAHSKGHATRASRDKKENISTNAAADAEGKSRRAPGRRRKEFSIRNLSRDKRHVRS